MEKNMNNSRSSHLQSLLNNSLAIRQEIQRFQSVHPSIYAIYDLIELIPDHQIAQQIRDHVVYIEDSFVNSQEWTISRSVPDIRLGIVGSVNSGKSALVHRYLTGSYMQEESPEGGRFKKEIVIDNQSYLLLIRDEGGPPEMQFAAWVDAIIYVFSLENEASFNAVYNYYVKMSHFRNGSDIPIILVGTQDAISERSPRVIDDSRARKLASDLKRCTYYETCATYGLNVERVFQDACQKIIHHRLSSSQCLTPTNSRPTTPQGPRLSAANYQQQQQQQQQLHHHHQSMPSPTHNGFSAVASSVSVSNNALNNASPNHHQHHHQINHQFQHHEKMSTLFPRNALSASSHHIPVRIDADLDRLHPQQKWGTLTHATSQQTLVAVTNENNNIPKFTPPQHPPITLDNLHALGGNGGGGVVGGGGGGGLMPPNSTNSKDKELPTPTSTPTTTRKSRRRSNLFIPSSKKSDDKLKNSELGSGRAIPLKQGYLYKRSSKSLNKEWKKKYVTLCDDGRLTYHPSLHDYMDDVHGKEIPLQYVTVKVPGQKPRGSKSIITNSTLTSKLNSQQSNGLSEGIGILSLMKDNKDKRSSDKVLLTAFDTLKESGKSNSQTSGDEGIMSMSNSNSQTFLSAPIDTNAGGANQGGGGKIDAQTPNVKKRHRRMKSSGMKNGEHDDSDVFEFFIVSLDNKQWHFEAGSLEERDEWVTVIEQEIFKSLQCNETTKSKQANDVEAISLQSIRENIAGNNFCVDCDAANPEWASLNLGVLMCIECSGVHRNLGSHISKVRSLGLDDWPPGHLSVMLVIGNKLGNSVWEGCTRDRMKPTPNATREEKEEWIRNKYEGKEFLLPLNSTQSIGQQLIEAVKRKDIKSIILLLAYASPKDINATVSARDLRTALHLSCGMGNLAISQLLIWHNANIKQADHEGRTCLAYAKAATALSVAKPSGNDALNNVSGDLSNALVDLLVSLGCPESQSSSMSNISMCSNVMSSNATGGTTSTTSAMTTSSMSTTSSAGTLPKRRETVGPSSYEKLPSII